MSVVTLINRADEVLESYGVYPNIGSLRTVTRYSICLLTVLTDINRQLRACHQELEKGVVTEPFPFSFFKNEKQRQLKGSTMEKDLLKYGAETLESLNISFSIVGRDIKEINDFYCALNAEYEEMNNHLKAIKQLTLALSPTAYATYYHTRKVELDEKTVRDKYMQMKMDLMPITPQKLKILQTQIVANALIAGIMDHDDDTTPLDYQGVNVEKFKEYLPDYYKDKLPIDFEKRCAKYHRHITWHEDTILIINYDSFGYSLYKHSDKITPEQFFAIYEHDMMLFMVHQDMLEYKPELKKYLDAGCESNEFGIKLSLITMFQSEGIMGLRTSDKYDKQWVCQLLDSLMATKWGEYMIEKWAYAKKRPTLKGSFLGGMKAMGVISGGDMDISRAVMVGNERDIKTFATYIGKWKDHPYYYLMKENAIL